MIKKINIILICIFCVSRLMAQTDTLYQSKNTKLELGHNIVYDLSESTGAISIATSDKLAHKRSIKNSNQLFGLLPGLQVLQNSGTVWENNASLYIRGLGTLNSKSPLILIDGFERSLNEISSEDIESVAVLKDAVLTSIYGIRGANGVIFVKTKRGFTSAPKINVSYEFNMGIPIRLPEFVDGYTYANALNEALKNDDLEPYYNDLELDAFKNQNYPFYYPNVNWVKETLRNQSFGDNVNFSARGGNKYVRYYTMLNFLDNRGILKPVNENDGYSTQHRYADLNIRTNLDITISPTTTVELNLLSNFSEHNRPGTQTNDVFSAIYQVPSGAFPVKTERNIWSGTTIYGNNPVAQIAGKGYARSQARSMFADLRLNQNLSNWSPGLSAGFRIGIDNSASYWDSNTKSFGYESCSIDLATEEVSFVTLKNEGNLSFSKNVGSNNTHFNLETYVKYDKTWQKHKLNMVVTYSMDKLKRKGRNLGRAFMDIIGQAHYSYDSRYLFDFSMSGSASSILDPNNQWGIFPAVGVGWIASNEEFLKNDWLDFLKLRLSYGISGRADFDIDLYKDIYGSGASYLFGSNLSPFYSMKLVQLGIEDYTYEKSHKSNVGIDFKVLKKLTLTIDAFYDHRTDILVDSKGFVSSIFGIATVKHNDGIVDNHGFETSIEWNDHIGNISYHWEGQFSFVRNTIKNMNEEYRPYDYLKHTGHPIGQYYGYEVIGIYKSQGDIDNRIVKQNLDEVRPGDLMFKDQNGDNVIDSYDQVILGYNSICPEIYYSFDLGIEYKGFGAYALFQGTGNYSCNLNTKSVYRPIVGNNTISEYYYENRWSETNLDGKLPRLTYKGSKNNYNTNSLWVTNASFLKLRTLEFYYQIPSYLLQRTKICDGIKIFARAHDLFCLDKINIQDPEAIGAVHPTITQYTFGFNVSF